MLAAWKHLMNDHRLGQLLDDSPIMAGGAPHSFPLPTPRDWYVATTVVQWLATNVGMGVLEAAGFKYQHWDEDSKMLEEKRKEQP